MRVRVPSRAEAQYVALLMTVIRLECRIHIVRDWEAWYLVVQTQLEHVVAPRRQIQIQPLRQDLVSLAFIVCRPHDVFELHPLSSKPGKRDV